MNGYLINDDTIIGKDVPYIGRVGSNWISKVFYSPAKLWKGISEEKAQLAIDTLKEQIEWCEERGFNIEDQENSITHIIEARK